MAKKKKYTNLGVVWKGEYGPYITFGKTNSKDEQYNFEVQLMVKNSKGEKVALVKNPIVSLYDPRNNQKRDTSKLPESLLYEVTLKEEVEE